MSKTINLKVAEAIQDDVNKGIVRIDTSLMTQLGVRPGDIVEIEGSRKTVAIVDRSYPGDIGLNIIRMDGIIRRNGKTSIGEMVKLRKADVREAKKVVIAPAQKGIIVRASPRIFKHGLLGRAVVKGDIVSLGGTRTRRTTMSHSPFFEDVFNLLDEPGMLGFGFSDIKFIVADASPRTCVIITESTDIIFNPEAVELKDEKVLEVAYEDIGGLDEEIKKIREMVELPLKHPEVFEALGTEPPKGVLLHGPPGTGKTLLAKAVANETNANFLVINGPEIMSKYYGQSLPYEEKVLVDDGGGLKRIPIGDIVEKKMKVKVACFDKKGKVIYSPVVGWIKHKRNSKLLEIKTQTGRKIKVTQDHSLFTLTEEGIKSIAGSELEEGKSFIAVPKEIPSINEINQINLLELLKNSDFGVVVIAPEKIKKAIRVLGKEKAAEILGVSQKYISDIASKTIEENIASKSIEQNIEIRVSDFLNLMKKAGIKVKVEETIIGTKGKGTSAMLKLTPRLCHFFGWWLAKGSYTNKDEARLSVNASEADYVISLCTKLFNKVLVHRKNENSVDVYICAGIWGKIMKALGFVERAETKKVPSFVFSLNKEKLSKFLSGYISGNGSIKNTKINKKNPETQIEISTESLNLADDICYLLLRFGIVANVYYGKNRPQKRICFADKENLDKFLEIGFVDEGRNKVIKNYIYGQVSDRQVSGSRIRTALTYFGSDWRNCDSIGALQKQKQIPEQLQACIEGDIFWDKIIEIKECEHQPKYVYDISVEPCQNFISGFGGIFAHNSEENLRKKFEEAEKNAPSIIFIDEIDAIAPKREEMRGEVERRVVAQLLSIMDGLKSRGKVVVIAATNIPNILDPALRRPGRFDREIEIGVPGKKGRLDILKIHTRGMPLTKSVNLKEIADMTHGFVGADLSALCKEAAMIVLRRVLPEIQLKEADDEIPKETLEKLRIMQKDFKEALKIVRPSALREVLIESPNVKWEEIGGLDSVKQELIEAIEWPLKHPEAFAKLGVKPPKGILLYGAPGTGKTLLAKAVATESEANFILVKGPELLCVSADTKILTSHCGATEIKQFYENIIPISKVLEEKKDYEVRELSKPVYSFGIGKKGEIKKTRIKTVHKLMVKKAYKVKFTNNAELTGSENQPLMAYRDNSLEWVSLKNIKKGDYIAYPQNLGTFGKKVRLPLPNHKHIKLLKEDKNYYYVKTLSEKEITKLPKKLSSKLAEFLGWFVAKGNISEQAITIYEHEKENKKDIVNLMNQFVEKSGIRTYKGKTVAYSTPLVKYLEQVFEQPLIGKKSYNIPSIIAKASKEVIASFLRAAYKGYGTITKARIEYGSMSKSCAEGFTYLLTILGIKSKYLKRKDGMYLISISGKKEIERFKKLVSNEKSTYNLKEYNAQYSIPPVASLLRKIKKLVDLEQVDLKHAKKIKHDKEIQADAIKDSAFERVISKRIGLVELQQIMKVYERYYPNHVKETEEFKILQKIARGDFLWTTVSSKKKAKPQIMFDVETEDGSFIGGNIPLLLHNSKWVGESEKAVREVFKKARQVSPTVIFFDEIDSLTPRRSVGSLDSHASERVVNQLLTEIDGLVGLHDIVIIGATNRPDMLDTALLRPGRFDRIIMTPVPDKESRLQILKIHTEKMPLKDVDLKKIADKTEGYVGADLEGVCREAAIFALREDIKAGKVTEKHFEKALEKVRPSVTKDIAEAYEKLQNTFRSARGKQMQEEKPSYLG